MAWRGRKPGGCRSGRRGAFNLRARGGVASRSRADHEPAAGSQGGTRPSYDAADGPRTAPRRPRTPARDRGAFGVGSRRPRIRGARPPRVHPRSTDSHRYRRASARSSSSIGTSSTRCCRIRTRLSRSATSTCASRSGIRTWRQSDGRWWTCAWPLATGCSIEGRSDAASLGRSCCVCPRRARWSSWCCDRRPWAR